MSSIERSEGDRERKKNLYTEHPSGWLNLTQHEEIPNTSPRRYRIAESDIVRELLELNSTLNAVDE